MPLNAESSKDFSSLTTLIPDPEEAEEIVVQEKLPVSVFGCVLPNLGIQDFSLPWLAWKKNAKHINKNKVLKEKKIFWIASEEKLYRMMYYNEKKI